LNAKQPNPAPNRHPVTGEIDPSHEKPLASPAPPPVKEGKFAEIAGVAFFPPASEHSPKDMLEEEVRAAMKQRLLRQEREIARRDAQEAEASQERKKQALTLLRLESLRREHNGIFGVRVFLGHDGHNVVTLHDDDRELARGESGRSLDEAAQRAERAWRLGNFWEFFKPHGIAEAAAHEFDNANEPGNGGAFTTAAVQLHVKRETGWEMTGAEVAERLEASPRVVRLRGGDFWFLLPGTCERHIEP
jgi:hypothetical protein